MSELRADLKRKTHEIDESVRKYNMLRDTLSCAWQVIHEEGKGISSLLENLDRKCQFSKEAHLLLAISDEAITKEDKGEVMSDEDTDDTTGADSPGYKRFKHGGLGDDYRQHWLLG